MSEGEIELRVLGHTELNAAGAHTGSFVLRQPKRLALLAYLALATTGGYRRRDQLATLLWPDLDQLHARTQLRKVLHALRSTLGDRALLQRGDDEVRLDPSHVWCDAVAFRQAVATSRWQEALALYRGDLLEALYPGGVGEAFQSWLEDQRAELRRDAARAAWECSTRADLAGQRLEALALARRAVELDPDDEEGVRRLIAALDRYGDRAGALKVYEEWQALMQEEYGAEPAPETRKLARHVREQRPGESLDTPLDAPRGETSATMPTGAPLAPRPRRRPRLAALAATLVLAAGLAIGARYRSAANGVTAEPIVAVLPLRGFGDSAASRFGEGLAEELSIALNAETGVSVRSAARAAEALRRGGDVPQIGRRLGASHVIDGAVRHDSSRLRITVRLVRVSDGVSVWSGSYDGDPVDVLIAQERVARAVAHETATRLAAAGSPKRPQN